jgi:uncharacterized Zn finger protein
MEQWIHSGIAATRKRSPGIASQLRLALRERREQQKNWPQVAAFYAEDFFDQPGARTLSELQKAAKRAGVEAEVRVWCRSSTVLPGDRLLKCELPLPIAFDNRLSVD